MLLLMYEMNKWMACAHSTSALGMGKLRKVMEGKGKGEKIKMR
jgi:hypothetical protein